MSATAPTPPVTPPDTAVAVAQPRRTILGYALLLPAFVCYAVGQAYAPNLLLATFALTQYAYWMLAWDIRIFTKDPQFAGLWLATLLLVVAYTAYAPGWQMPAVFLTGSFIYTARLYLFKLFTHTRVIYLELCLAVGMVGIWIWAVATAGSLWMGLLLFFLPVPQFFWSLIMTYQYVDEGRQLLRFTRRGYRINVGDAAPDFVLPDENGTPVRLSDFRGQRHVLLLFVRGDWCPHCHMMLRTYEKSRERFLAKNVLMVAIGPDPVGVNKAMVLKLNLDYRLLSDDHLQLAQVYGVEIEDYRNAFATRYARRPKPKTEKVAPMPLPASFLVDKDGIVRYTSRPDRVGEFLNPGSIFPELDRLA